MFLRAGDSSLELSADDIIKLELDRGIRRAEDEIVEDATLDDIDDDAIELFRKNLNISATKEEVLKNRGLLKEKNGKIFLNKAGIILFGKNPTQFLPSVRVRFIRYDGIHANTGTRLNVIKDINIEGALNKVIDKSKETILAQLRDFTSLDSKTGLFTTIPEYPEPNNSVLLVLKNNIMMRRLRRDTALSQDWDGIWNTLSEYEQKAVSLAYANEKITASTLSEYIDRSVVSARRILHGLKEKNILAWFGTSINDSKQYYKLKDR